MTTTLRPYQAAAVSAARDAITCGNRSVLVVAPTGAGKGTLAAHLLAAAASKGRRAAFCVHRAELVRDIAHRLQLQGIPRVTVEMGTETARDADALVTVATVQTLAARTWADPACSLLVVDEAHHATCDTYRGILERCPSAKVVGLTATPQRHDGRGLGDTFDVMVVAATMRELTEQGYLVPATVYAPPKRSRTLAEDPVQAYLARGQGRRALVFASTVRHALEVAQGLRDAGVACAAIHADDPQRRTTLEAFARRDLQVLVNVGILTEGYDDPSVSCVVLARGVGHVGAWLQIVGRGLRPSAGKADAIVLDLCGSVWDHGLPSDDRAWTLEGAGVATGEQAEVIRQCPACGGVFRAAQWADATCPACGHQCKAKPNPKVVRAALEAVKATALARGDVGGRIATLRTYADQAKAKGFKPGWALYKFQQVYNRFPSKHERQEAGL